MQPGLAVIISTTRGSFGPYATAALQVITPPDILNSLRALNLLMNLYSNSEKEKPALNRDTYRVPQQQPRRRHASPRHLRKASPTAKERAKVEPSGF